MTYKTLYDAAKHIARHHRTFAGHITHPTGTRIHIQLVRAEEYAAREKTAVSVGFDAELNDINNTKTTIFVYFEPTGYRLVERVNH